MAERWIQAEPEWVGWTAGIIDGEGTVTVVPRHRTDKKCRVHGYFVKVMVGNTCKAMVEKLVELWGGSIYERKFAAQRPNRAVTWSWCVTAKNAANVLGKCLPLLVCKREQALLAIQLQSRISSGYGLKGNVHQRRSGITPSEEQWRREIYLHMKTLNIKPGVRLWQATG